MVCADQLSRRLWRVGILGDEPPERVEVAGFSPLRPAIAVSGNRLVFQRPLSNSDIYRFVAGRPPEAVAASSFSDWNPDLSPDGRRVAWASGRGGEGDEIWLAAADGQDPAQLTHGPGLWQGSPRWSPDGRRIAFDSHGEDGRWDIWTIDTGGGAPRRLTNAANNNTPTWSLDGRFVYFSSDRTGSVTVWRVPSTGGAGEQVTRAGGGRSQEGPDGKTLFFQRDPLGASPLLAVSPAGGVERAVLDCAPRCGYAVGAACIYHTACGGDPRAVRLSLLDPATGRDRLLGWLDGPGMGLSVSADGKTILYTKVVGEGSDLVLIENFR